MKRTLLYLICLVGILFFSCTPASVVIEEERDQNNWDPTSETYIPKGSLTHLFSVSPTKKVFFSKGNLQYNLSDRTFRFAQYQYEMLQSAVNLEGENSILEYFPYGTSGAGGTRPNSQERLPQQDISETAYDWGEYCPISNAENLAGFWRMLTSQEWEYLLNKLSHADIRQNRLQRFPHWHYSTKKDTLGFRVSKLFRNFAAVNYENHKKKNWNERH